MGCCGIVISGGCDMNTKAITLRLNLSVLDMLKEQARRKSVTDNRYIRHTDLIRWAINNQYGETTHDEITENKSTNIIV